MEHLFILFASISCEISFLRYLKIQLKNFLKKNVIISDKRVYKFLQPFFDKKVIIINKIAENHPA